MVQQAFIVANGMNSLAQNSIDLPLPPSNDYVGNGKPHQLSAQSSLQHTDDSQSLGSFFNDQQTFSKQKVLLHLHIFQKRY